MAREEGGVRTLTFEKRKCVPGWCGRDPFALKTAADQDGTAARLESPLKRFIAEAPPEAGVFPALVDKYGPHPFVRFTHILPGALWALSAAVQVCARQAAFMAGKPGHRV
eukprot:352249-Chlamydomonas_euryale.AAC.13